MVCIMWLMEIEEFFPDKYFGLVAESALDFSESIEYKKVSDILFDCYKREGTVFTTGCGGSASTATHFAADLTKTTMVGNKPGFRALALVDNIPLVSAWTNTAMRYQLPKTLEIV